MCSFLFISTRLGARIINPAACKGLISATYKRSLSKMTSEAQWLTSDERIQALQELQSLGWTEIHERDAIYKEYNFKTFNQHYNYTKHPANAMKSYLERKTADKTLTVMDWLTQNPDLNIIEALWDHLDKEINKRQPKSKEELWEVLKEVWYYIPEDYFRKL
ncbi:pterin-4-alpha-carbinolamine dehydratase 2 isoform X1 [Bombina bombina]|uniref:pterin-4-alpha-carbinolamine dehydratase 2 isoform X1 n=1 Tax=Bombina bombina TaxID=8345 RepID=UPI00235ABDC0|nr:pterin-4-alpha-carbinolamine dehydratase 2 isoform X1 [Bombina bombina]